MHRRAHQETDVESEPEIESETETATADPSPKLETKVIRHDFTPTERNTIGSDLARAIAGLRGTQAEFDQVKASYKARTTEAEARIDSLSTSLMNGFDMRETRCRVAYSPKERLKFYFREQDPVDAEPVMTEEMTAEDFQAELIQAESDFERREELQLFPPAGNDRGIMVVGRFKGMWFAALRVRVGAHKLEERLDSEQASSKKRADAVRRTAKRAQNWLADALGKDAAKGFEQPIDAMVSSQKEREE